MTQPTTPSGGPSAQATHPISRQVDPGSLVKLTIDGDLLGYIVVPDTGRDLVATIGPGETVTFTTGSEHWHLDTSVLDNMGATPRLTCDVTQNPDPSDSDLWRSVLEVTPEGVVGNVMQWSAASGLSDPGGALFANTSGFGVELVWSNDELTQVYWFRPSGTNDGMFHNNQGALNPWPLETSIQSAGLAGGVYGTVVDVTS